MIAYKRDRFAFQPQRGYLSWLLSLSPYHQNFRDLETTSHLPRCQHPLIRRR
jgi:hypothetical protein